MSSASVPPAGLPLAQADGTAFSARAASQPGSQAVPLALPPGARVVAEVVRTQTGGEVLLRLGQTLLAATLPGGHTVGQQLSLVVLSEPGAQPLLLLAPPGNPVSSQAQLSATALLLGRLQQPPQGAVLQPTAPVWAQPSAGSTAQLAMALGRSIKASGLFYESHLAAWAQGQLPMPELLSEPQGRLSPVLDGLAQKPAGATARPPSVPGATPPVAAETAQGPFGRTGPFAPPLTQAGRSVAPGLTQATSGQPQVAMPTADGGSPQSVRQALDAYAGMQAQPLLMQTASADLPAQLQGLVQQQLATLMHGSVMWAGSIWPGQDLQWTIEPDDAHRQPVSEPAQSGWTSVLKLDLPRLGALRATLHIGADRHLRVSVEHAEQAASLLAPQRETFRQALQDAGLQLDALTLHTRPAA
ncbi:conserved hypothetical protein [Thiomonas sp. X19]|uniref:flagellar hook-length control protein FliK n=1 Tax=Thiomonas sp. X19 TaxID=1050370 RepID=UPI000B6AFEC8|nr:flagellar hook-length control protein FliK [Thiomonas sp. X19]SCC91123.1 conserved hypothetical protein [Thiomonas sp. X19]